MDGEVQLIYAPKDSHNPVKNSKAYNKALGKMAHCKLEQNSICYGSCVHSHILS